MTGDQVKTVTVILGTQVVMVAVIVKLIEGLNTLEMKLLLEWIDFLCETSRLHFKKAFLVMKVNLQTLKVACFSSILSGTFRTVGNL